MNVDLFTKNSNTKKHENILLHFQNNFYYIRVIYTIFYCKLYAIAVRYTEYTVHCRLYTLKPTHHTANLAVLPV